MARIDLYDPVDGGFKAPLASAIGPADVGKILGAGIDVNGRVVRAAGQTGVVGVVIPHKPFAAGEPIDVMTDGQVVEATLADLTTVLPAGSKFYSDASGVVTTTNSGTYVGHTVAAGRLIVRVAR